MPPTSLALKYLSSRKMWVIFVLGFASGLPTAIVSGLLPAWCKTSGLSIVSIGFLSLLGQPHTYKFLWAPLIDRYTLPLPWFNKLDHRRAWILTSQLAVIFIVLLFIILNPINNFLLFLFAGLLLTFSSATQDIVIDAYRINVLDKEERGLGASIAVEGYRLAMIIAGSLGLVLADNVGWPMTYLVMASLMSFGILAVLLAPAVVLKPPKHLNLSQVLWQPLENFLKKEKAIWLLILVPLYKIGDVCSHALITPFLLDLDFSLTSVGTINKLVGTSASLIGIMCAGIIMVRVNLFKALLFFGFLQALSNLLYMALAIVGKNYSIAIAAFFIENLCSGMGNGALVAFLMSLCSKEYSATQYALLSSLTAIGRVYIGPLAGWLVALVGWQWFYFFSTVLAIPSILLIFYLKPQIITNDNNYIPANNF